MVCFAPPIHRDFGTPPACGDGPSHNRAGWVTSVAGTTGTVGLSNGMIMGVPLVAITATDAEDAAEQTDQWPVPHLVAKST